MQNMTLLAYANYKVLRKGTYLYVMTLNIRFFLLRCNDFTDQCSAKEVAGYIECLKLNKFFSRYGHNTDIGIDIKALQGAASYGLTLHV